MFFQTGPVAIACASDNELNRCPWSTCQKRGCDSGNPNKPTQLSLPRNQLEKWPHMMTTKKIDKIHFILQRMGTSVAGGIAKQPFQKPAPATIAVFALSKVAFLQMVSIGRMASIGKRKRGNNRIDHCRANGLTEPIDKSKVSGSRTMTMTHDCQHDDCYPSNGGWLGDRSRKSIDADPDR